MEGACARLRRAFILVLNGSDCEGFIESERDRLHPQIGEWQRDGEDEQ
jgi:hypothetical protein